jgi:hypothetical protein
MGEPHQAGEGGRPDLFHGHGWPWRVIRTSNACNFRDPKAVAGTPSVLTLRALFDARRRMFARLLRRLSEQASGLPWGYGSRCQG